MSSKYLLSFNKEMDEKLRLHPIFEQHKTMPAFLRFIVGEWLESNDVKLLDKFNSYLNDIEKAWIKKKTEEERYSHSIAKQFSDCNWAPRSLLQYTIEIYEAKRLGFDIKEWPTSEDIINGKS